MTAALPPISDHATTRPYRSALLAHYASVKQRLGSVARRPATEPPTPSVTRWPEMPPPAPYDHFAPPPPAAYAWKAIAGEVARKHGVTFADICSQRRERPVCRARHEAFWRLRQETDMSLPVIGRMLGHRDHTTVLHGIRMHAQRMAVGR